MLILDTTYKVNNKNMHLTTLMVTDGSGNGQTVAHALLNSENAVIIHNFLEWFASGSNSKAGKVWLVLVDKDFSKIGAIEKALSEKKDSSVHVARYMRDEETTE